MILVPDTTDAILPWYTLDISFVFAENMDKSINFPKLVLESLYVFFLQNYNNRNFQTDTSQLLLLGKVEYGGGPIFKVVLEC